MGALPWVRAMLVLTEVSLRRSDAWFQAGLTIAPFSPGLRDIGTLLLGGVERLLLCVRPRLRRVPCISALLALT
jgi:hypothetical protein